MGGMEQRKTILFLATIEQQLFRKKISILFRKKISIFSDNHILVSLCLDGFYSEFLKDKSEGKND